MYKLMLTHEERKAIDWIGDRYSNGDELSKLLWGCEKDSQADWDDPVDITFSIPEHVAWQIRDNADAEDGSWPCFAPEFAEKMQAFCDAIV